ncbi:MAG TPA: PEP/pyruvate-binding domain-containing protein [Thermodesulfobacteriota bacterium]|nr:PEP/pyruvate-binding domain-containing protein [Thermodesulfobacteriota bacterium]
MSGKWIYWFGELSKEANDFVGKKCANLGELTKIGLRVPPGFALSVDAYRTFMEETGAGEEIKEYVRREFKDTKDVAQELEASKVIRGIIEDKEMPSKMKEELTAHYGKLCQECQQTDLSVAVRSSGAVSMPGQMETYLNVKGAQEVVKKVIEVWGSAFTARAISFRFQQGLPIDWAPIGVAVLKMVNAKCAGVVLTVIPTTGDTSKIIIEGNWGLGESVVSGEINPDSYIVDKETLDVARTVAEKTKMVVYSNKGTTVVDIPEEKRRLPILVEEEVQEIAKISKEVERHYGVPQDVEWVVDLDLPFPKNLFFVQARPAKAVKKKENDADYIIDLMARLFR